MFDVVQPAFSEGIYLGLLIRRGRETHEAQCDAAASAAEADVLHATASSLRARLEEATLDLGFLRDELSERDDEIATLKRQVAALISVLQEERATA